MDFNKLEIFFEVVETGSFSKAAEKQYISQRAVSQTIKKLENELGFKLFKREKNKIEITDVGMHFYQKAKIFCHSFNVEINFLKSNQEHIANILHVGYFSPFEGKLLRDHIYNILKKNDQQLDFAVNNESIEHLVSDVNLGQLDFAYILDYGTSFSSIEKQIDSKVIYKNQMVIGVSKLSDLSNNTEIKMKDVLKYPVLYYTPEDSNYLKQSFISTMPAISDKLQVARVADIEQMQTIVALNQAIAYYPKGLIENTLGTNDHIKYIPIENTEKTQEYRIRIIYKKNSPKIREIKKFIKTINT